MVIDGTDPFAAKPDARLIKLLLRARRFNATLAQGEGVPFAALAEREGVSRSYFTRLVRLSYLAPDITQAILDGRQPPDLRYLIDFVELMFHQYCCHRSETILQQPRGGCLPTSPGSHRIADLFHWRRSSDADRNLISEGRRAQHPSDPRYPLGMLRRVGGQAVLRGPLQ